jgi:hypothetical protein
MSYQDDIKNSLQKEAERREEAEKKGRETAEKLSEAFRAMWDAVGDKKKYGVLCEEFISEAE